MASRSDPKTKKSGLLHRLSGCANLALAPLLALQCVVLWFVVTDGEITLPDTVRDRVRSHLEAQGVSLSWGSGSLRLTGRVDLQDVAIGSSAEGGRLIEVSKVVAKLDIYALLLKGEVRPLRLTVDGGKLLCPAIFSPTGKVEEAIGDVRATLVREGNHYVVESLQARCANVPLVAYGHVVVPAALRASIREGADVDASAAQSGTFWREAALIASKIVELRPWARVATDASLELFASDAGDGTRLDVRGLIREVRHEGVVVREVALEGGVLWNAEGVSPSRALVMTIGSVAVSREATKGVPALEGGAEGARLVARFGPDWELPTRGFLTLVAPVMNGNPVDRVTFDANWAAFPSVRVRSTISQGRSASVVKAILDTRTGVVDAGVYARVFQDDVVRYPAFPKSIPTELESLKFTDFVDFAGNLRLGPGYRFKAVDAEIDAGQTNFGAIDVQTFSGGVRVTPEKVAARDLCLISPTQRVEGLFESGFTATSRYRLALRGNAYPDQVSPFVGDWWHRIWADLSVTKGHPVSADIYVDGHWDGVPYQFIFGAVSAEKFGYQGVVFDRARIRILEEPTRIAIYDLHLDNDDKTMAGGRLEWVYRASDHELDSVRFLFNGELPLATGATLGGPEVVEALADVKVDGPARVRVLGRYHGPAGATPEREQLQVDVYHTGNFVAWGLAGDAFRGTVLFDDRRIRVRDAKLRFAGGDVTADAWLHRDRDDFRLTFDATFSGCERVSFFEGLAALKNAAEPSDEPESTAKPAPAPAVRSELSGSIRARVALSDIDTFDGVGHAVMLDNELFKLPLFGAFSRGLDRLGIKATTYHFDKAEADFIVRRGSVYFPKLTVLGPDAVVDAGGRYNLESGALNFRAVLNPNAKDSIPVIDWARSFVNRGTKLFPVDIVGTLENPEWSVDPTPSALFRSGNVDLLGLPPAPAPDDGRW